MKQILSAIALSVLLAGALGCSTFRSSKGHSFPAEYKPQLHGWLHDAEGALGLKYKGGGIKVHIVDGTQVTRGRSRAVVKGELLPSHARLGSDTIYLVRYPSGHIKPEEGIHEFQHMIGDSHGWPRDNDWHHRKFKELRSPY